MTTSTELTTTVPTTHGALDPAAAAAGGPGAEAPGASRPEEHPEPAAAGGAPEDEPADREHPAPPAGGEPVPDPAAGPAAEEEVVRVPLGRLRPHPLNPRRHPGDVAELAASVAKLGVLEPLLVVPRTDDGEDGGGFYVVAGTRRLAAAALAGREDAPCLVRDLAPRVVVEMALVENAHRASLSVMEEAAGYFRAIGVGSSVSRLAKVMGRPTKHVRARLALLELPEAAQRAVDAGTLGLGDAEALGRIKDDPALVAEVLALPDWERRGGELARTIDRMLAKRAREAAVAAARAEEEARGRRVLDAGGGGFGGAEPVRRLGLDPAAHEAEPCHAVAVTSGYGSDTRADVTAVCTEPRRHTAKAKLTNRSDLQVTPVAVSGQSAEHRLRQAERKRVAQRRSDFVAGLLDAKGKRRLPKADATAFALRALVERLGSVERAHAGRVLGLVPAKASYGGLDWSAVDEAAAASEAGLLRVAFALAAGVAEANLGTFSSYGGFAAAYLDALVALGYELDAYERAELDRAAAGEERRRRGERGEAPAEESGAPEDGEPGEDDGAPEAREDGEDRAAPFVALRGGTDDDGEAPADVEEVAF